MKCFVKVRISVCVVDLVDFFPRPKNATVVAKGPKTSAFREMDKVQEELKKWLVRRVECIRGRMAFGMSRRPCGTRSVH